MLVQASSSTSISPNRGFGSLETSQSAGNSPSNPSANRTANYERDEPIPGRPSPRLFGRRQHNASSTRSINTSSSSSASMRRSSVSHNCAPSGAPGRVAIEAYIYIYICSGNLPQRLGPLRPKPLQPGQEGSFEPASTVAWALPNKATWLGLSGFSVPGHTMVSPSCEAIGPCGRSRRW